MQHWASTSKNLDKKILDFCRHVAGNCQITSVCLNDEELGKGNGRSTVQALLIIRDFQTRLMSHPLTLQGRNIVIFAVDQWIFERDVDRGLLGEALASVLLFPYMPKVNADYLHEQEIALKQRLILELLENMVISFPQLSPRMRFKPEYFMYEVMLKRVRVFPPLAYGVSNFLCEEAHQEKVGLVLRGYEQALRRLETSGQVSFVDGYVVMSKKFLLASNNPRVRLTNLSKNAPRALFTSLFGVYPQLINFFVQNTEAFFNLQKFPWRRELDARHFIDPQKYVFVPTAHGWVSLADKVDISGYARKVLASGKYVHIKVEEIGGVLNDVYLITASKGTAEDRIVVKRFKDWSSFKWFPLSMWSVGARTFAVLGKSRLEREVAIGELLGSENLSVPKVLHVSHSERLVFMEFIEGENLSDGLKRIALAHELNKVEEELTAIAQVGEIYAQVHALGVVLGDTKPENVMLGKDGKVYLFDFEQASRGGDKAWDIAEFLYYSGHYIPLNGEAKAEAIARAFVSGYLRAGGEPAAIKQAATPKYTRVFSIWALPSIIRIISVICKKGEKGK